MVRGQREGSVRSLINVETGNSNITSGKGEPLSPESTRPRPFRHPRSRSESVGGRPGLGNRLIYGHALLRGKMHKTMHSVARNSRARPQRANSSRKQWRVCHDGCGPVGGRCKAGVSASSALPSAGCLAVPHICREPSWPLGQDLGFAGGGALTGATPPPPSPAYRPNR